MSVCARSWWCILHYRMRSRKRSQCLGEVECGMVECRYGDSKCSIRQRMLSGCFATLIASCSAHGFMASCAVAALARRGAPAAVRLGPRCRWRTGVWRGASGCFLEYRESRCIKCTQYSVVALKNDTVRATAYTASYLTGRRVRRLARGPARLRPFPNTGAVFQDIDTSQVSQVPMPLPMRDGDESLDSRQSSEIVVRFTPCAAASRTEEGPLCFLK